MAQGPRLPKLTVYVAQFRDGPWLTRRVPYRDLLDLHEELHDTEAEAVEAAARIRAELAKYARGAWEELRWPESMWPASCRP